MNSQIALIEGLLFLSGEEGLTLSQLALALDKEADEILSSLTELKIKYDDPNHGIELAQYAGRYKFVTKEFVYEVGRTLFETYKEATLSQAALETLAIIAYKQPITRVEIEEIRGVNCEMMLKKLLARDLISANERLDAIGKPLLYRVTDTFLDVFGLESLKELPDLPALSDQEEELFDMQ